MEKTKFELECEEHCSQCIKQSMDICNLPGHCKEEAELARCGVCGNIYCSEEALTELNICATCESKISSNVDANNEIVNKNLFAKSDLMEIKDHN
jgi:hypothetical protein